MVLACHFQSLTKDLSQLEWIVMRPHHTRTKRWISSASAEKEGTHMHSLLMDWMLSGDAVTHRHRQVLVLQIVVSVVDVVTADAESAVVICAVFVQTKAVAAGSDTCEKMHSLRQIAYPNSKGQSKHNPKQSKQKHTIDCGTANAHVSAAGVKSATRARARQASRDGPSDGSHHEHQQQQQSCCFVGQKMMT